MTVIIAGAGPTGLTLACELVSRGVPCRVYDKADGLFVGSRGKGLTPRTQEVFDLLGVGEQIRDGSMPFPSFRIYSGKEVVAERTLAEMFGTPVPDGPQHRLIPQWRTDKILYDRLLSLGGEVVFGAEVTDFHQDNESVTATVTRDGSTETARADYLVGADGGRSTIRKASGVGFAGETFPSERTLIGDVRVTGLDGVFCHILSKTGDVTERFALWNLPDSHYYQFVTNMPADQVPPLTIESVRQLLVDRSGRHDIELSDLRWISLYKVNVRMVDRFRLGRVLLAGDAAHVHSSAGGQGLNTSVQDAHNLGWKLAAVLAGAPEELLDTYEAERMPVAAQVLGVSTTLHKADFRPTLEPAPAIHQLDITYRHGPLALDDRAEPGRLRAGDRAPDVPLPDGRRLFDVLRGPHFTLLAFGMATPDLPGVRVQPMEPSDAYDIAAPALVLVRPDGYVGAISGSAEAIHGYLKRVAAP
ncbi:FAD-dependent monooxygenase [Fodinicola acaciae]|uniref:FAD-dependent monooxygenase n=1 Tax=Fodinicola acaciae TaxID=2681555 RepID=UPI0013D22F56|nr:FAD-dependent monooxygenase [Fodinicola acaciae]